MKVGDLLADDQVLVAERLMQAYAEMQEQHTGPVGVCVVKVVESRLVECTVCCCHRGLCFVLAPPTVRSGIR